MFRYLCSVSRATSLRFQSILFIFTVSCLFLTFSFLPFISLKHVRFDNFPFDVCEVQQLKSTRLIL